MLAYGIALFAIYMEFSYINTLKLLLADRKLMDYCKQKHLWSIANKLANYKALIQ